MVSDGQLYSYGRVHTYHYCGEAGAVVIMIMIIISISRRTRGQCVRQWVSQPPVQSVHAPLRPAEQARPGRLAVAWTVYKLLYM